MVDQCREQVAKEELQQQMKMEVGESKNQTSELLSQAPRIISTGKEEW